MREEVTAGVRHLQLYAVGLIRRDRQALRSMMSHVPLASTLVGFLQLPMIAVRHFISLMVPYDNASSASLDSGNGEASSDAEEVAYFVLPDDATSLGECDAGDISAGGATPSVLEDMDVFASSSLRPCGSIFHTVEELYAFLLLRGPKPLNEDQYKIVRAGHNLDAESPLPSLTRVRYDLVPRLAPWFIPSKTSNVRVSGAADTIPLSCILPSSHLRRGMRFSATYDLFFAADRRTEEQRRLEPDFADTSLFNDRQRVLLSGKTVQHFILDGARVSVGDTIHIIYALPDAVCRATIADAFFVSH